ncbi:MAG: hypothetical protein JSS82_00150 [Bacteroidetes bacterium]|nr:hypothetical protein [Bacteroidota bacterium]
MSSQSSAELYEQDERVVDVLCASMEKSCSIVTEDGDLLEQVNPTTNEPTPPLPDAKDVARSLTNFSFSVFDSKIVKELLLRDFCLYTRYAHGLSPESPLRFRDETMFKSVSFKKKGFGAGVRFFLMNSVFCVFTKNPNGSDSSRPVAVFSLGKWPFAAFAAGKYIYNDPYFTHIYEGRNVVNRPDDGTDELFDVHNDASGAPVRTPVDPDRLAMSENLLSFLNYMKKYSMYFPEDGEIKCVLAVMEGGPLLRAITFAVKQTAAAYVWKSLETLSEKERKKLVQLEYLPDVVLEDR